VKDSRGRGGVRGFRNDDRRQAGAGAVGGVMAWRDGWKHWQTSANSAEPSQWHPARAKSTAQIQRSFFARVYAKRLAKACGIPPTCHSARLRIEAATEA
jgi:hypothetical protein